MIAEDDIQETTGVGKIDTDMKAALVKIWM